MCSWSECKCVRPPRWTALIMIRGLAKCVQGRTDLVILDRPDNYINYRKSFPFIDIFRDYDYFKKNNYNIKIFTFFSLNLLNNF